MILNDSFYNGLIHYFGRETLSTLTGERYLLTKRDCLNLARHEYFRVRKVRGFGLFVQNSMSKSISLLFSPTPYVCVHY